MVFSPECRQLLFEPVAYIHPSWVNDLIKKHPIYAPILRGPATPRDIKNKVLFQLLQWQLPRQIHQMPEEHIIKIMQNEPQKLLEMAVYLGVWLCADSVLRLMDGGQIRQIEAILGDFKAKIAQNRPQNQYKWENIHQAMALGITAMYQYCMAQCPEPEIWGQRLLCKLPKCTMVGETINERIGAALYFYQNNQQIQ